MTELKRCLCGGEPFIYNPTDTGYEEDYIGDYYCVECEKCGRISETFDTEEEAIETWNKRVVQNGNRINVFKRQNYKENETESDKFRRDYRNS